MQDVDLLEKLWGTVTEWQQLYNGWKDGRFGDLKVEEMEEAAGRIAKSLQRLGREVKHWPAWTWIKVNPGSCLLMNCGGIMQGQCLQLRRFSHSPALGAQLDATIQCTGSMPARVAASTKMQVLVRMHVEHNTQIQSNVTLCKLRIFPLLCLASFAFQTCRKRWIRSRKQCR